MNGYYIQIKVLNAVYEIALVIVLHYAVRSLLLGGRSVRLLYHNSAICPAISRSLVHRLMAAGNAFLM